VVREDFIFLAGRSDNPSRKTKREKDKVSFFQRGGRVTNSALPCSIAFERALGSEKLQSEAGKQLRVKKSLEIGQFQLGAIDKQ
jgi:hypothetical protein